MKGVIEQLRRRGARVGGFNAAIDGTIPMGAGMSSSAALEVATALVIRRMFPFALRDGKLAEPPQADKQGNLPPLGAKEKMELAKLCQAAENEFVGVKCGLLDQASSLFGKAHHAIELDFLSVTVEHAPMFGDIAIVTCNSGVKHQLVGGEYNELRELCESAAKKLGAKFLRSVDPKDLAASKDKLTEREYQCAYHVVGEITRVVHGERALRDGDFAQFGQFMFQSHESSRDYFKNSTRELGLARRACARTSRVPRRAADRRRLRRRDHQSRPTRRARKFQQRHVAQIQRAQRHRDDAAALPDRGWCSVALAHLMMVGQRCSQRAGVRRDTFNTLFRFRGAVRTPRPTLRPCHRWDNPVSR